MTKKVKFRENSKKEYNENVGVRLRLKSGDGYSSDNTREGAEGDQGLIIEGLKVISFSWHNRIIDGQNIASVGKKRLACSEGASMAITLKGTELSQVIQGFSGFSGGYSEIRRLAVMGENCSIELNWEDGFSIIDDFVVSFFGLESMGDDRGSEFVFQLNSI